MHVSFRGSQLVVTWQTSHITEGLLEGVLVRDRETHHYNRIIPLPLGTTVSFQFIGVAPNITTPQPHSLVRSVRLKRLAL